MLCSYLEKISWSEQISWSEEISCVVLLPGEAWSPNLSSYKWFEKISCVVLLPGEVSWTEEISWSEVHPSAPITDLKLPGLGKFPGLIEYPGLKRSPVVCSYLGKFPGLRRFPGLNGFPGLRRSPVLSFNLGKFPGLSRCPGLRRFPGLNRFPGLKRSPVLCSYLGKFPGLSRCPDLSRFPGLRRFPGLKRFPGLRRFPGLKRTLVLYSYLEKLGVQTSISITCIQWDALFSRISNTIDRSLEGCGINLEMSSNFTKFLDVNLCPNKWLRSSRLPITSNLVLFVFNDGNLSKDSVTWKLGRVSKVENTEVSILTSGKSKGSEQIFIRSVRDVSIVYLVGEMLINTVGHFDDCVNVDKEK